VGEEVLFWVLAPLMVIAALGLLFARKAVHVAMAVVVVMVSLAVLYFALAAPFLGVVQIVVYTGAVMMLFLFVVMLVGVDRNEDLSEKIRGQRWIALLAAGGVGTLLVTALWRVTLAFGALSPAPRQTNPDDIADFLFSRTLLTMEVLGVLLITAAVGALVLTHVPRLHPRRTQSELQAQRIAAGDNPVNKMMPGVYARHNALDIPALDPDGKPIEESVSRVLKARKQSKDGKQWRAITEGDDK
jgi:NADH-quinone oxidoreductase subunit J